ncbi:MAG: DEAD/DEAH box helicase family protein [Gammaproteobacteria bacterium]|nr:DEAD/DEAH box helicase family protein [Gammaproteobacteria bacterium]
MFPEFGLTINSFFDSLSDTEIRKFFDTSVLSVLDALAHGKVEGLELKRIATTYVDLDATLNDTDGRRLVLSLIPVQKRGELEARVDRSIEPSQANSWTNPEITRLRDFFGLMDEQLSLRTSIGVDSVEPVYGLFQHQRGAVEELLPLLTDGDQRAVLHLPTGVGKTRTAMHVVASFLRNNEPSVVVWLASGKELLEQAGAAFQEAWSNLGTRSVKFGVLQGQQTLALEEFDDGFICVGLAKAWSMLTGSHPDWTLKIAKKTRLVVFDEAH